jgi:hypothetical protein
VAAEAVNRFTIPFAIVAVTLIEMNAPARFRHADRPCEQVVKIEQASDWPTLAGEARGRAVARMHAECDYRVTRLRLPGEGA